MKTLPKILLLLSLILSTGFIIGYLYKVKTNVLLYSNPTSPTPNKTTTKLLFGGDIMLDRSIRQKMVQHGVDFPLEPLFETMINYDAVIANLEGPVTDFPSISVNSAIGSTNNFIFTFDPSVVPMLKNHRISIVNLGNNHIRNFGENGVTQTKNYLTKSNIQFFGNTGLEENTQERVLYTTINGHKLAFVNVNQFVTDGFQTGLTDVTSAHATGVDFVIVMPHWGNEYEEIANSVIQSQAHQLIDAGADLIIGSHPHVVQQVEEYQGKKIYYSLGNFIFDQYFSDETKTGLLVGVTILPNQTLVFEELPIKLDINGQTSLILEE